jgi:general secretion pathway protein E
LSLATSLWGIPTGRKVLKTLEKLIEERNPSIKAKLSESVANGERFEEALIKSNLIGESELLGILAEFYGFSCMEKLSEGDIDRELIKSVPIAFAKKYKLIPIKRVGGAVEVAFAPPIDLYVIDEVRSLFGVDVVPYLVPGGIVIDCINKVYERGSGIKDGIEEHDPGITETYLQEPADILDTDDEAPIIRFVNSLFYQAVKERASDIHIECFEKEVTVRFRKDGILHEVTSIPKRLQSSVISRVKIMAELDIAEKRKPQDGRIRIKVAGRDVDVRISTVPTTWGESVVMRLLDRSSVLLTLEELGLSGRKLDIVNSLIHRPHGIVLVTGPTGSGKTTTLYAALERINSPDKKIITIEDPVEYQIQGINQIQVNTKVNLTFANGLRSILRQDPDVILVGEIRDRETADIAIHASLTGHLVFATLHTNDAASAITRLVDMGIEPFLVASSLLAVIAQRLVRVLCPYCKEFYFPSEEERRMLSAGGPLVGALSSKKGIYRAGGCSRCIDTGYSGRIAIFEILTVDDDIRGLILSNSDSSTIKKTAIRKGMTTLREDGESRVLEGITSIDEIIRVTQEDEI